MNQRKRLNYIILVVTSFLIFCICLEVSARLIFSSEFLIQRFWANNDLTWKFKWLQKQKKKVKDNYTIIDQYDSTKGWITKSNLRDVKVFDGKILNTNSLGLRGKQEFSFSRSGGKKRIILLGDSFTFGEEVSDDETFGYYLQQKLPEVEIINMGVHGYGHDQMLIFFRELGVKFKPDIVILGFIIFDIHRNVISFRDYAKPQFILKQNKLVLTNTPVPTPTQIINEYRFHLRFFDLWNLFVEGRRLQKIPQMSQAENITNNILQELAKEIEAIQAKPIFAYFPSSIEMIRSSNKTKGERFFFSMCKKIPDINYFSTRDHFMEKINAGESFSSQGHWCPNAHKTAAESIYEYLVINKFVEGQTISSEKNPEQKTMKLRKNFQKERKKSKAKIKFL